MGDGFFHTWSYLGVFLGIVGTGAGLPIPEELPVVVGGALSGAGEAKWYFMLPVCIIAVIIGDSMLYCIGRFWGPRLIEKPFIKKHILPPERLEKIEGNFEKYGIRILLFARLTPGIRAPIFLTAGIVKLPWIRFMIADGIYAVPGVSLLFYLGFVFTEQMVSLIENEFSHFKNFLLIIIVLAVAGYFVYRFLRKPHVTGAPEEMPKLAEEVVHTLDSVKSVILHPHARKKPDAKKPEEKKLEPRAHGEKEQAAPPTAHAPTADAPPGPGINGQVASGEQPAPTGPLKDNKPESP